MSEWQEFLKTLTHLELVRLVHDLRGHPEDRAFLKAALIEMLDRASERRNG